MSSDKTRSTSNIDGRLDSNILFLPGFTTTVRPPRAIDSKPAGGFLSGRNLIRNHAELEHREEEDVEEEVEEEPEFKPRTFPKFGVDGRRPKVKSNIRAKLANLGGKKKFFQKFDKTALKKSGRKVGLDHKRKNKIEFVEPQSPVDEEELDTEFTGISIDPADKLQHMSSVSIRKKCCWHQVESCVIAGPELRPDGRSPRVKSDLFFEQREQPSTRQHETTTQQPFVEPFFASPSSPQPFIFRGTPDPYNEPDLFGSASTIKPFFPTVKSVPSSISQSPFSISPSIAPPKSDIVPPSFQGTFSSSSVQLLLSVTQPNNFITSFNQIILCHC